MEPAASNADSVRPGPARILERGPAFGSSVALHGLAIVTLAAMAWRSAATGGPAAEAGPVTLAVTPEAPEAPAVPDASPPATLPDAPLAVEPVEVAPPTDPPPPSEELAEAPARPAVRLAPPPPPPLDRYSLARAPRATPPAAPPAGPAADPLVPPRALATAVTYPPGLRDEAPAGVVLLRLLVRADGTVGDVRVHETSGLPALDAAAADAARAWRFAPATRAGVAVPAWVEVPVRFA